ncbi:MAG: hypothetical protein QW743_03245 [Candidatus Methanomethylicia archaeon]
MGIFREEAYCSYCNEFVKVKVKIEDKNGFKIERKICIRCGRIVEERFIGKS